MMFCQKRMKIIEVPLWTSYIPFLICLTLILRFELIRCIEYNRYKVIVQTVNTKEIRNYRTLSFIKLNPSKLSTHAHMGSLREGVMQVSLKPTIS